MGEHRGVPRPAERFNDPMCQWSPSNGTCLEHFTQEAAQSDAHTTSIGSFQYGGAEAVL